MILRLSLSEHILPVGLNEQLILVNDQLFLVQPPTSVSLRPKHRPSHSSHHSSLPSDRPFPVHVKLPINFSLGNKNTSFPREFWRTKTSQRMPAMEPPIVFSAICFLSEETSWSPRCIFVLHTSLSFCPAHTSLFSSSTSLARLQHTSLSAFNVASASNDSKHCGTARVQQMVLIVVQDPPATCTCAGRRESTQPASQDSCVAHRVQQG